jgi:hypothetical protein
LPTATDGVSAFPLNWPVGAKRSLKREDARFRVTFGRAVLQLMHELRKLGAKGVVLSTNIPLRNDGMPYASERNPDDPGVAVYFTLAGKSHAMSCDRWRQAADNVKAIAMTIEAMRGIARWGSQEARDQAFRGFQALPPSAVDWRGVLGFSPGEAVTLDTVKSVFRGMALRGHPDRGGSDEVMKRLNVAMDAAEKELGA